MALEIKKPRFLQKKEWLLCNDFFVIFEKLAAMRYFKS